MYDEIPIQHPLRATKYELLDSIRDLEAEVGRLRDLLHQWADWHESKAETPPNPELVAASRPKPFRPTATFQEAVDLVTEMELIVENEGGLKPELKSRISLFLLRLNGLAYFGPGIDLEKRYGLPELMVTQLRRESRSPSS